MSIITDFIGQSSMERVRDRIALILADELAYQLMISYDERLKAKVYAERYVPTDVSQMPYVNVLISRTDFESHSARQMTGINQFFIDIGAIAKSTETDGGESRSQKAMQRLVTVVNAILMNTKYITLGFAPPFIQYRRVMSVQYADPNRQDSYSVARARITLMVSTVDVHGLSQGIDNFTTRSKVKLYDTDKGYLYAGVSPEPVPDPSTFGIEFDSTFRPV